MAKKSKAESGLNVALLTQIAAATASGGYVFVNQVDGAPLLNHQPPLIVVNNGVTDPADASKVAAKTTDAGNSYLASLNAGPSATGTAAPAASPYAIIRGAVLPERKRGFGNRAGAPTVYPFDKMEIGETFFVPVSEKHPDPVKTLGSTVSSANMRYATKTGESRLVKRATRGADHKALLDANGKKIVEEKSVPVYKFERKFSIRGVEAGKQYGNWVAPATGALIARVNPTE